MKKSFLSRSAGAAVAITMAVGTVGAVESVSPAGAATTPTATVVTHTTSTPAVAERAAMTRWVNLTSRRVRAGRPIPVTWTTDPAAPGIVFAKKPGKKRFKVYRRVTVTPTGRTFKIKLPIGTRLRFYIPARGGYDAWSFRTRIKRYR